EQFRSYLAFLAQVHLDPRLQGKADPSGVVQLTLVEAFADWHRVCGLPAEQQQRWVRRLLLNNLTDEVRRLRGVTRDVPRHQSPDAALEQSSVRLAGALAEDESTPSARCERRELEVQVAHALDRLLPDEREAVVLQHWHGWSLNQIAERLQRTPGAV